MSARSVNADDAATSAVADPRETSRTPVRGLPDPGERVPTVAWPTVVLLVVTFALLACEVALFLGGTSPWVTVPMGAVVTFLAFSVLHEATHHAASTDTRLNDALGRLAVPLVAPYGSFPMLKFIHIEHHRNTNEPMGVDPDAWTSEGPAWQLPLRWLTIDAWYTVFYVRRLGSRPRAERIESLVVLGVFVAVLAGLGAAGLLAEAALLFFLPQRLGLGLLAWWFDYLPHHGLTVTQREDRYRATRLRVGAESVLTPLFVYQNYHLVHHLHPSVPFYRYVRAWRRNEQAYLDRDAAITTWFGKSLTPEEYRTWRRLTDPVDGAPAAGRRAFHPLRVASVEPEGSEGVAVTFEVPEDLHEAYACTPGQHVTVRARIDGADVRRTYSVCDAPRPGHLRVGVRRHPHGVFSTWAATGLEAGDVLDVMTPGGSFGDVPGEPDHLVGLAAGSGITPVKSVVEHHLASGAHTTATLLLGNRSEKTAMFLAELRGLASTYGDRFDLVEAYGDAPGREPRRVDADLVTDRCDPASTDAWLLCGPEAMVTTLREDLIGRGVPEAQVRTELFGATDDGTAVVADLPRVVAEVEVRLDGRSATLRVDSTAGTLLEAALDAGVDLPYSCAGGACGTCLGRVTRGSMSMDQNHALDDDQVAGGAVLACQARPTSEHVAVDFD